MSKIKIISEDEIKSYKDKGYVVYTDDKNENFILENFEPVKSQKVVKQETEEEKEKNKKKIETIISGKDENENKINI